MKTIKHKTNINCSSCLNSITPFLNDLDNIDSWNVDLKDPDKLLTVVLDDDNTGVVAEAIKKAGFVIKE